MSERLDLLTPILSRYRRRFSVLDLGCGDGRLAREIADMFDAAVFAFDRNKYNEWDYTSIDNSNPVTFINGEMTVEILEVLSRCEHFDVVLAMNFLHHFDEDVWRRATDIVMEMGNVVFIQLAPRGTDRVRGQGWLNEMTDEIEWSDNVRLLGDSYYAPFDHRRPVWVVENEHLRTRRLDVHTIRGRSPRLENSAPRAYSKAWNVNATHWSIVAYREPDGKVKDWIVGMNLWNICQFSPHRPSRRELARMVREVEIDKFHGDVIPWNFIYDGRRLHLIDWDEYEGREMRPDNEGLEEAARMVEIEIEVEVNEPKI